MQRVGREIGQRVCAQQPAAWLWRGRQVKLVDGTTLSMPDSAASQARFPRNQARKAGLGFPLARWVAIVSLSCGVVLEWAKGPCEGKEEGETALLWALAQKLQRGGVVIADRCHAGYFMVAWLMHLGVDVVIRQHQRRHTDFRCGKQLGRRDHLVSWRWPKRPAWMSEAIYASMPECLALREARAGGWLVVSTLTDARQVSKRELCALCCQRWQVELDIRCIKAVMHMDVLRCMSPRRVEKEIAVHLTAYNLVRAVMARAAYLSALLPRQLSFKAALQLPNAFEQNLRRCPRARLTTRHAIAVAFRRLTSTGIEEGPQIAALRLSGDALHRLNRCDDRDALIVPTEAEQMLVPGDDEIGLGRDGTGEHMIVVGIVGDHARHVGRRGHGSEAPDLAHDAKGRQPRRRQALGELLARYHVEEFRHQHRRTA